MHKTKENVLVIRLTSVLGISLKGLRVPIREKYLRKLVVLINTKFWKILKSLKLIENKIQTKVNNCLILIYILYIDITNYIFCVPKSLFLVHIYVNKALIFNPL